jgi:hypothetical protein
MTYLNEASMAGAGRWLGSGMYTISKEQNGKTRVARRAPYKIPRLGVFEVRDWRDFWRPFTIFLPFNTLPPT